MLIILWFIDNPVKKPTPPKEILKKYNLKSFEQHWQDLENVQPQKIYPAGETFSAHFKTYLDIICSNPKIFTPRQCFIANFFQSYPQTFYNYSF
jgi:hypothetical protein